MKTGLIYLITTLIYLHASLLQPVHASVQTGAKATIAAKIPSKVDIRLYGYTAPNALVQAASVRIFAQVSSDRTGYFLIDPLPVSTEAKEICLTTIDSEARSGFPLCIGLEDIDKPTEIGPLLLSPTLSISGNNFIQMQQKQSQATGVTLPDTDIEISFSNNGSNYMTDNLFRIIPQANAIDIARITTKTDKYGSFSINLPTTKPLTYRLFARAFYLNSPTPKSQTLTYFVSSYTNYWLINIFPRWIIVFIFIFTLTILAWYERKTKKGRLAWNQFNETRLRPWQVMTSLKLRRIWYNFQARLKSNQK